MDKYLQMPIPATDKSNIERNKEYRKRRIVEEDIDKINAIINGVDESKLKELHIELDGKYGAYIPNWGYSMYVYNEKYGFSYELIGQSSLVHNLSLMKAKLKGFAAEFVQERKSGKTAGDINVNLKNNNDISVCVSITFEQARQQIEDMTSLTEEQTKEVLEKITEIENTLNDGDTKKSKWEKLKPILTWIADKSFDVAMTLLPLILKIRK